MTEMLMPSALQKKPWNGGGFHRSTDKTGSSINVAPMGRVWSAVLQARVSNVTHLMVKVCPEYLFSNSKAIAWLRAIRNSSEV